ncbi:uncharacterized protein I303_104116 [Kwoniella dejecticola CBS 10117]|uniref:Adenylosuccinate lyase C-terminal domain-containing protein n=1 Tax=Kwoniella dejecticola CBS 10117 TaxID=1296121 RepID=A0A1A6A690_9TREE|nr:uncharacterized protein I303_04905 [Kwoniella dejecticola CBS 10117]OBR85569.1 hypothetical protein I303_04905 [Kwoniella dejecticola CBS 10117]
MPSPYINGTPNGAVNGENGGGLVGAGWDSSSWGIDLPSPLHSLPGNVSMLDSAVFRTMFGTDKMREIMCDKAYVARLVEVEVALAKVEGDLGIIPAEQAAKIAKYADPAKINLERLRHETDIVGYSILPVIRQIGEMCGESGKYVHIGFNTQDIHDLAVSLQIKAGLDLVEKQINEARSTLLKLAKEHRNSIMMGRTHLQHALPITFGYKCAIYLDALDRHAERLQQIRPRALLASIGGASGSLGSMGMGSEGVEPDGVRTISAICKYLGLTEPKICIHVARDHIAEIVSFLANVCGTLAKIAFDIILLSAIEISEVKEPFVPHRGASSTMPHKRNPISSEIITAIAKLTRSHASTAMDALVGDFERPTGPWHLEFVVIPETFTYASNSLNQANFLLSNMSINTERMVKNLSLSNGLIMAEHVMVGLADKVGRIQAHDIIYEDCKRCIETGESLNDLLKVNKQVTKYLTEDDIDWRMNPRNYLGSCLAWVDKVVAGR